MKLEDVHMKILEGMTPAEQASFREGLKVLNMVDPVDRAALRESIRKLRPDFSEAQLDIFVEGKAKSETDDWIV